ncbi:hypothetical protein RND71_043452 [Anisodus tanguticus]|uniref:DM2 domain-containing protein n=1 Tax=Anisodus tanguticus TaxID=243964 RepID=A0AAE1QNZ2_9SOLA|nr:hypothetical protein RND71_043452 [Anisodus tanguticus]
MSQQRIMAPPQPHLNQQIPMSPMQNQQHMPPQNLPPQGHVQNQQVRLMGPPPPPVQRPMFAPQQYMTGPTPPNPNMGPPPQQQNIPLSRTLPPQQPQQPHMQHHQPMQQGRMAPPPSPGYVSNANQTQMIRPMGAPIQQNGPGTPNQSLKRPQMQSTMSPMNKTIVTNNAPISMNTAPQITAKSNKKKKLADKILPQKVRDLVPESQAYMDLLAFERKLDFTITRKRLDIQEAIKRPMKQKRKLRIFISNTFYPGKPQLESENAENTAGDLTTVPSWELRVEGRLLDDQNASKPEQNKMKRKFSSFFKSLVIELDKDLYGPDNHLVEWHRTTNTAETDGFQVKRPGDKNVKCTILLLLDYQPLQFKLDSRLARLLGIHTQTRPMIINALWQYIKTHKLQDAHEREFINCDKYLEQIFNCNRMRFGEIPSRLTPLLNPADPIVINHLIGVESGGEINKKTACYDIEVEIDDQLKQQMNNFFLSTGNQQEIQNLDNKIHETVDTINELKTNREFLLSFANDPQKFIQKWLISQMRDLKVITDQVGNPEEERKSDFFYQAWTQEAVCRYFYGKVQQKRAELEQALGIRNS